MVQPLFVSKNGAILWQELPEALRLYDNPSASRPGDLRLFLDGFGALLDRFEATLGQYYADGFATPDPENPAAPPMQGWIVPYMADLFGVNLYGPDPDSRRAELAESIWVARRRGSRLAVDRAAESLLQRGVVTVAGLDRVLFTPSIRTQRLTSVELTGRPHPRDAVILHAPVVPPATWSAAAVPHPALPAGLRDLRKRMRAVSAAGLALDADSRPVTDPTSGTTVPMRFRVEARSGLPCFPGSYEDRALRTPDIRLRTARALANPAVARPDTVYLHVSPPPGVFAPGLVPITALPQVSRGQLGPLPGGASDASGLHFSPAAPAELVLDPANAAPLDGRHEITGLRLNGRLRVTAGCEVTLVDSAVFEVLQEPGSRLVIRRSLLSRLQVNPGAGGTTELEYVTITGATQVQALHASDCILTGLVPGAPGASCLRYCRIVGAAPPAELATPHSSVGPVPYLLWPCLPGAGTRAGRVARFGEPGYGVLSDEAAPAIANGAEDGGEVGAYHDRFHLARLAAAARRAEDYTPAGHRVLARYDLRLAAPLPTASHNGGTPQ